MKLIFLGPPGSGKGTYSTRICDKNGWTHISTGDILRDNVKRQTATGMKAKQYMDKGALVPDAIVISMVEKRLKEPDCKKGFIFDGFPRTIAQAEALGKITDIDMVVNLVIPDWVLVEKILARRTCEKCGDVYNIADIKFGPGNKYHMPPIPPKRQGTCNKCSGKLITRSDETKEVIENRLKVYKDQTEPLIKHYRKVGLLRDVDVIGPPDTMVPAILKVIGKG